MATRMTKAEKAIQIEMQSALAGVMELAERSPDYLKGYAFAVNAVVAGRKALGKARARRIFEAA